MKDDEPDAFDDGADDLPQWRRFVPFVLAVIFAVALGFLIYRADHAADLRDRAISLQRHSYQVMLQAKTVEATVGNAERLLARYVISGDASVGRQFQEEWATAMRELVALERSTRNNVRQREIVSGLRGAMTVREKTLTQIALSARNAPPRAALSQLQGKQDDPATAAIASELKAIVRQAEAERARHNIQVDQSKSQVDRLNESYGAIGLGLLLAVIGAAWLANGALNERLYARRLANAEAARVDGLEAAVHRRTEQLRAANEKLYREMEERLHAEQSVRQLQKMEALGQFTGGIAHDFNNMLAVVVGGIDLARRQLLKDPAKAARHLASATEGANHAAALIERLLAFARAEPLLPDRVDIDGMLRDMEDLVSRVVGSDIRIELDLNAHGWAIWVDRAQLESALVNMAINARDAMDGRGTLRIATGQVTLAANEIGKSLAGEHVSLSVTDTGCGMSAAVLERAFEPFFTTKPVGKGTGLGMSQIFGFVNQCRGVIDIKSVENEGTTICLLLPRMEETPNISAAPGILRGIPTSGTMPLPGEEGHVILVVEDDPRVMRSTLSSLSALGHRAIACNHPAKAGELLSSNPQISLILTDVLMPDMTGPDMVEVLSPMIADRPVIFVTGYAGDNVMAARIASYPLLRKPFTVAQLANMIEDVMQVRGDLQDASETI